MNTTEIILNDEELKDLSTITLHFDVCDAQGQNKHSIPLDQFIKTAEAVRMIVNDFNRVWFDGKLPIELYMPALEEGGVIMFIESHPIIGGGIVTLTGGSICYIAYNLAKGAELDKIIQNIGKRAKDKVKNLSSKITLLYKNKNSHVKTDATLALSKISLIVIMFLALSNEDLIEAGITPENNPQAFIGKNQFFEAARANNEIKGIGFDKSDNFIILRADFKDYISDIPPEQTIDNPPTEEIHQKLKLLIFKWKAHILMLLLIEIGILMIIFHSK